MFYLKIVEQCKNNNGTKYETRNTGANRCLLKLPQ